jgi:hypothetical protein
MKTEFQCVCGYGTAVDPAALKSGFKCERCSKSQKFTSAEDGGANCFWIMIGSRNGTPTRAVPLLDDRPLALGSSEACWLVLSGDGVQPMNTELRVDSDRRVHVRHLADAGRTWIDRAAILEGVLEFNNELRIGDSVLRLCTTATLLRLAAADAAPVVIENDDDNAFSRRERAGDDDSHFEEESRSPRTRREGLFSGLSAGQKARALGSVVVLLLAGAFIVRMIYFPAVSDEMPTTTTFTCPVDGTKFSGAWRDGTPKCPECGQLVFGSVSYKPKPPKKVAPPKTLPATAPADPNINDVDEPTKTEVTRTEETP